jgi:hypothetical protein
MSTRFTSSATGTGFAAEALAATCYAAAGIEAVASAAVAALQYIRNDFMVVIFPRGAIAGSEHSAGSNRCNRIRSRLQPPAF